MSYSHQIGLIEEAMGWLRGEGKMNATTIGKEVETFHRGRIRRGRVDAMARKATESHGEEYVWVRFPDEDLVGTMYERKLCPVRKLK